MLCLWALFYFQFALFSWIPEALSAPRMTDYELRNNHYQSLERRLFEAGALRSAKDLALPPRLRPLSSPNSLSATEESASKIRDLEAIKNEARKQGSPIHPLADNIEGEFLVYDVKSDGLLGKPQMGDHSTEYEGQALEGWGRSEPFSQHGSILLGREVEKPSPTWRRCFPTVHDDCLWTGWLVRMLRAARQLRKWISGRFGELSQNTIIEGLECIADVYYLGGQVRRRPPVINHPVITYKYPSSLRQRVPPRTSMGTSDITPSLERAS